MSEFLRFQGRLAEKELEAKKLALRMAGLRDAVRNALDPFESPEDLKADQAADQALELATVQIAYKECLEEIRALKKALGR